MLKFNEDKIKIEFPSDFKITIRERLDAEGNVIPLVPLLYVFRDCNGNEYMVSHDGTKGVNCVKYDDRVELIFENYNLFGHITYTEYLSFRDGDFSDGFLNTRKTYKSPIFIHNCGCHTNNISIIDAICTIDYVIKSTYSAGENIEISDDGVISAIVPKKISELENDAGYAINNDMLIALNKKVDKVVGKGLSTNDFTTIYKNKLDSLQNYTLPQATKTTLGGIKVGNNLTIDSDGTLNAIAKSITIDSALSTTSTNPVQNKVINDALNNKVSKETGKGLSTNDFTNEYKDILDNYDPNGSIIVDSYLSLTSTNPVQNKIISSELNKKLNISGGTITGSLTVDKKLKSGTLILPKNSPTDLESGEVALYYSADGTGGETPSGGNSGSGGVSSYVDLTDKPQINEVELKSGNNTLAELGIASLNHTHTIAQISNLQSTLTSLQTAIGAKWTYNEATIKAVKVNNAVNADKLGGQLPAYYAKASDLTKYLPLAGGEMTGNINLKISTTNSGFVYTNDIESGGWDRKIAQINSAEGEKICRVGFFGNGTEFNRFYVGKAYSGEDAWLAVGDSIFTYKTKSIYHAGNSNLLSVAWKAKYLQLPILTTAPSVSEGVAIYYSADGVGGETPTGGSGVSSYVDLTDKPKINGVELNGNKSLSDLGIASLIHTHTIADITGLQIALDAKVKQVKIGTTAYNPASGIVTLPAYPTTLPASDVYAWAKATTKPTYTTAEVTEKTNLYFTNARAISALKTTTDALQTAINGKWTYNEDTIKAVKVNNAVNADQLGGQLPAYYAKASDLTKYLPLAGGEMTGNINLKISTTNSGFVYTNDIESGGWDRKIAQINSAEGEKICRVGFFGNGTEFNRFYVGKAYSGEDAWLAVSDSIFTYKTKSIYHAGNSNLLTIDWKAKKLTTKTLVIPTTAPTDLGEGEIGLYWDTTN